MLISLWGDFTIKTALLILLLTSSCIPLEQKENELNDSSNLGPENSERDAYRRRSRNTARKFAWSVAGAHCGEPYCLKKLMNNRHEEEVRFILTLFK